MLNPRFTEGDIVVYCMEWDEHARTGIIVDGPFREGIWWGYMMEDGTYIRDAEISHLISRVSDHEIPLDSGV